MRYCFLFCLLAIFVVSSETFAQAPNTLSYQGLLTTALGTPVPDGLYKLQFDIFTTSTGGLSIWTEVDSQISVQRGTFSTLLGTVTTLPDSFHRSLYVQVAALAGPGITGVSVFSPRSALASAPSALGLRTPAALVDSLLAPVLTITNRNSRGLLVESMNSNPIGGPAFGIEGRSANAFGVIGVGADNHSGLWGFTGSPPTLWYDSYAGIGGYGHGHEDGIGGISDSGYAVVGYPLTAVAYAGVFFGKLAVSTAAGDTAVQLPDNSIASHEILDEPGITSHGTQVFFTMPAVGTLAAVDSVTITTPADGYIVIDAGGNTGINHNIGQVSEVDTYPDTSSSLADYLGFQAGYVPSTLPTDYFFTPFHCHRVVARARGTYNFYLHAKTYSGTGTCYVAEHWITATYYPKSYGAVSVLAPLASNASLLQSEADYGILASASSEVPTREVDLRGLEIQAAKLRAEASRLEDEILKAKSRIKRIPE